MISRGRDFITLKLGQIFPWSEYFVLDLRDDFLRSEYLAPDLGLIFTGSK
jgi:hypothetical protein